VKATKAGARLDFLEKPLSTEKTARDGGKTRCGCPRLEDEKPRACAIALGKHELVGFGPGDEEVMYADRSSGGRARRASAFSVRTGNGQGIGRARAIHEKNRRGRSTPSSP